MMAKKARKPTPKLAFDDDGGKMMRAALDVLDLVHVMAMAGAASSKHDQELLSRIGLLQDRCEALCKNCTGPRDE